METYEEDKKSLQKIIRRMKAMNPKQGSYFEEHIVFDDEKQTLHYNGEKSILAKILLNAKTF